MPRPSITERARMVLSRCEVSVSGQKGHNAALVAAIVLVKGFDLPMAEARALLTEWNSGCMPPWSAAELEHKLKAADELPDKDPRGYLARTERENPNGNSARWTGATAEEAKDAKPAPRMPYMAAPKPEFSLENLQRFAGDWTGKIDLLWLANRSAYDPAEINANAFLRLLYKPKEKVVVFTDEKSQGQAVWPDEALPAPTAQPRGAWFLAQPTDGKYYPNPRATPPKLSRRSEESVTAWRYLVIESDKAPLKPWLAAVAQMPLRIAAIYSSGGKSVHVLVRVDRATKANWDEEKRQISPGLVILGADLGAMTGVRLTRLPGYVRQDKIATPQRGVQKLLYLNPEPTLRALTEVPVIRDVEALWLNRAEEGIADGDDTGGQWQRDGLGYYAGQSVKCRLALINFMQNAEASCS